MWQRRWQKSSGDHVCQIQVSAVYLGCGISPLKICRKTCSKFRKGTKGVFFSKLQKWQIQTHKYLYINLKCEYMHTSIYKYICQIVFYKPKAKSFNYIFIHIYIYEKKYTDVYVRLGTRTLYTYKYIYILYYTRILQISKRNYKNNNYIQLNSRIKLKQLYLKQNQLSFMHFRLL